MRHPLIESVNDVIRSEKLVCAEIKELTANYNCGFITANWYIAQLLDATTTHYINIEGVDTEQVRSIVNYKDLTGTY